MAANNREMLDVAIIGSGPAAFTAALYVARENSSATVYERESIGGLAGTISNIENYPGFTGTGMELMGKMREQAESFGAKTEYGECTAVKKLKKHFELMIDDTSVLAKTVLVATGSERRKLGIPGEDLPGISYCATCDAPMTTGKEVLVVGGGNTAAQEAFHLLKYCVSVKLLVRSGLRCNDVLKDRLKKEPRIEVITGVVPTEIERKEGQLYVNTEKSGVFVADNLFIFVGAGPATKFLPAEILAEDGSVKTRQNMETEIDGLFAAGDCRLGSVKQAVVAAGEGAAAARGMSKYLEELRHTGA
ncbi:MAG: FAD-dependent oxidoreductase [Candidatus Nomurabacteria bacterium]|jgi:thioredoxin reductase (NADPH)|nr:FAD-dependent oxidoreductase [Candidatus Nomurabacteria bacterium]